MGTPSSERVIQDVNMALKALEMVYHANGAAVEGLADRNIHIRRVVDEVKSVSWRGAQNKGKGRKCGLTKNIFLHSDLLKLCLKKNTTSLCKNIFLVSVHSHPLTLVHAPPQLTL